MANQFTFRFESILNVKEKMEEDKKNKLGLATKKMEEERQNLYQLMQKKENIIKDMQEKTKSVLKIKELQNASYKMQLVQNLIDVQVKVLEDCKEQTNKCRNELIEAKKQKKIFCKLKENDFEHFQYLVKKDEEKFIDQLVTYKTVNK